MRRLVILILILAVLAVALNALRDRSMVHFSGDLATELERALSGRVMGLDVGASASHARVEVVSVTDWEKLAFVPGAIDDCGPACAASSGAVVVRQVIGGPLGIKKKLFLNIRPFLSEESSDVFVLGDEGFNCLADILALEISELWPDGWDPACMSPENVISEWRIGFS